MNYLVIFFMSKNICIIIARSTMIACVRIEASRTFIVDIYILHARVRIIFLALIHGGRRLGDTVRRLLASTSSRRGALFGVCRIAILIDNIAYRANGTVCLRVS